MSTWIPELEFHLFDSVQYCSDSFSAGYNITSSECKKSASDDNEDPGSLSLQGVVKTSYRYTFDQFYEIRQKIVELIEEQDIRSSLSSHEVGISGFRREIRNRTACLS